MCQTAMYTFVSHNVIVFVPYRELKANDFLHTLYSVIDFEHRINKINIFTNFVVIVRFTSLRSSLT